MNRTVSIFMGLALFAVSSTAYALYSVSFTGDWPKTWPSELEPLRQSSRTLVGPVILNRHYAIPFSNRDDFEAAWQHLLTVRNEDAPIFLVRGPNFFLGEEATAGVVVHSPPAGSKEPEAPVAGDRSPRSRWSKTTYIELVVDGEIVDLNRIELPKGVSIVDRRFPKADTPAAQSKSTKGERTGNQKLPPASSP